jgi:hypothetical protein
MVAAERALFLPGRHVPFFGFPNLSKFPIFHYLFIFTENIGSIVAFVVPFLVLVPAVRRAGTALAHWISERPRSVAAAVFVLLSAGSLVVYHNWPLAQDEYAPLFQASTFSHGHLTWTCPPELLERYVVKPFWSIFFAVAPATGATVSTYWPGFAMLLTPFVFLGVPWASNPLITAATLLVLYDLARKISGSQIAGGWAMLFALASPVFMVNGVSFYSMPAHLLASLVFVLLVLEPTPRRLFLAGLVGGLALTLNNPVPHILFALPCWLWLLSLPGRWRKAACLALGYLPLALLLGVGWSYVVHTLGPAVASASAPHGLSLEAARFYGAKLLGAFERPDAFTLWVRLLQVAKLWLWAVPGLLLLAAAGLSRARGSDGFRRIALLLGAPLLTTIAGYFFIGLDQGHGWGYRYLHAAWGGLPILAALFVAGAPSQKSRWDWASIAGGLAFASLLIAVPARMAQTESFIRWNLDHEFAPPAVGRYVIFVKNDLFFYSIDLVQNLPGKDRVVRLLSKGDAKDAGLMSRQFPGAQRLAADARGSIWQL